MILFTFLPYFFKMDLQTHLLVNEVTKQMEEPSNKDKELGSVRKKKWRKKAIEQVKNDIFRNKKNYTRSPSAQYEGTKPKGKENNNQLNENLRAAQQNLNTNT